MLSINDKDHALAKILTFLQDGIQYLMHVHLQLLV